MIYQKKFTPEIYSEVMRRHPQVTHKSSRTTSMSLRSISGILSVGIISAGNFLASYLMINFSPAVDYGIYVFIFSGLMLAAGIQNAIICTPMTIMAAKMDSEKRNSFVSSILSFQIIILSAIFLSACIGDFICMKLNLDTNFTTLNSIALLTATFLLREFLRIRGYLYKEAEKILLGDTLHFAFNTILLIGLTIFGLSIELVIASLCASNLLYISFEVIRSRIRPSSDIKSIKHATTEAWERGGKWSLPGVLATWGQNNAFIYLSGLLISIEATATLAAIRLLLMPTNIIASGLTSVYKPVWAHKIESDFNSVRSSTLKLCAFICIVLLAYISTLALAWEYIITYIFGGKINAELNILFLWGAVFTLQIIRSRESNILQLLEDFKYLTVVGVPASIVCLIISLTSTMKFGASGALYGIIVSELIMIMLFHRRWSRD